MTQLPITANPDERWYAHKLVHVEAAASTMTPPAGSSLQTVPLSVVPVGEMWLLESVHLFVLFGVPVGDGGTIDGLTVDAAFLVVSDADLPAAAENEVARFGQIADVSFDARRLGNGSRQWAGAINRPHPLKISEGHRLSVQTQLRTNGSGAEATEIVVRAQFMRLRNPDVV